MGTSGKFTIQQFQDDLYLISLPVPLSGFDGFIGAWLYTGEPVTVVDVGPSVSAPHLLAALSHLGVASPELILLTHIHIDHAGGIGVISDAFTDATVVCHPKGVRHLIDPEKLWQGSVKTLGDIAKAYEPIVPVNAAQVVACDDFSHPRIESIKTPGHAAHHVSYLVGDLLFAGEAGGVHLPMPGGSHYLRPATPPVFFMETTLESIDRLIDLTPQKICYGHIGKRDDAVKMLMAHRGQLLRWFEMIQSVYRHGGADDAAIQSCVDLVLTQDPLLASFSHLPPAVQQRERTFLVNSIKGYWGYLKS